MERIFLSIIVPVYNTEKYLADCLDSLLDQNIPSKQYEIICVDDGSTDGSPQILDKYAKEHENVYVIHKENGGVSSARNIGVEHARGEYIWFIDADDCIRANILGAILPLLELQQPEVLKIGLKFVPEDYSDFSRDVVVLSDKDILVHNEIDQFPLYSVCVVLISKELLKTGKVCFNESLKYCEDEYYMFCLLLALSLPWYEIDLKVYNYRQNMGSVVHQDSLQSRDRHICDALQVLSFYQAILDEDRGKDKYKRAIVKRQMFYLKKKLLGLFPYSSYTATDSIKMIKANRLMRIRPNKEVFHRQFSLKSKAQLFLKEILIHSNRCMYMLYFVLVRHRNCTKNISGENDGG